ncbi:MAG: AI-2E family transporter [Verrucomicrobiota bacterium]|nr:AI-2E family transporter [Verrucomicrobiota bacterium]
MAFPSPSEKQAKVLWFSLTALAVAIFLALLALLFFGIAWLIDRLSPVLLPLVIAGIVAFLLNPLVTFFEGRMSSDVSLLFTKLKNPKRVKAILTVFLVGLCLVATVSVLIVTTVVPNIVQLTEEAQKDKIEKKVKALVAKLQNSSWGQLMQLKKFDVERINFDKLMPQKVGASKEITTESMAEAIRMIGLLAGLALVPVYVFYFLLEARSIEMKWSDYLPLKESWFKDEAVFVLQSFNDSMVVVFRGQILVAICVGICLAIGFAIIKLPYGIIIGLSAGLLGIIPYFGVIVSTIPVLLLSLTQGNQMLGGSSWAPVTALGVCVLVLFLEKTVIQPRIIGDRVGMHPVAVIISVLIGTTLVGGVIGGLLAIPIAMALRAVLFRYVWVRRKPKPVMP